MGLLKYSVLNKKVSASTKIIKMLMLESENLEEVTSKPKQKNKNVLDFVLHIKVLLDAKQSGIKEIEDAMFILQVLSLTEIVWEDIAAGYQSKKVYIKL